MQSNLSHGKESCSGLLVARQAYKGFSVVHSLEVCSIMSARALKHWQNIGHNAIHDDEALFFSGKTYNHSETDRQYRYAASYQKRYSCRQATRRASSTSFLKGRSTTKHTQECSQPDETNHNLSWHICGSNHTVVKSLVIFTSCKTFIKRVQAYAFMLNSSPRGCEIENLTRGCCRDQSLSMSRSELPTS